MPVKQVVKDPTFSPQFSLLVFDQEEKTQIKHEMTDQNSSTSVTGPGDRIGVYFHGNFRLRGIEYMLLGYNGAADGCTVEAWVCDGNNTPVEFLAESPTVVFPSAQLPEVFYFEFPIDLPDETVAFLVKRMTNSGVGGYAVLKMAGPNGGVRLERHGEQGPWEYHTQDGNWFRAYEGLGIGVKVFGGMLDIENESVEIPGEVITIMPQMVTTSSCIYIDWNTRRITFQESGDWPALCKQLYILQVGNNRINSIVDKRAIPRVAAHTTYQTQDDLLFADVFNQYVDWTDLDLTDVVPKGATGVLLGIICSDSGQISQSTEALLKKPGDDTTKEARAVAVCPQVSGLFLYSTAPVGLGQVGQGGIGIQYSVWPSGSFVLALQLLGWIFGVPKEPEGGDFEVGP